MRIKRISVEGLFGKFDRVIPLNMDDRITIIHGPNGFGKTIILEMIDGFFNANVQAFDKAPFYKFIIEFDSGVRVEICKSIHDSNGHRRELVNCDLYQGATLEISSNLSSVAKALKKDLSTNEPHEMFMDSRNSDNYVKQIVRGDNNTIIINYSPDSANEKSVNTFQYGFGGTTIDPPENNEEIATILFGTPCVYLIEAQRLIAKFSGNGSLGTRAAVSSCSEEFAGIMQSKFSEYGLKSQELDRTFPRRSVQRQVSFSLASEELRRKLGNLENRRHRLIEVGLLEKGEDASFQLPEKIDDSTKDILSIYIDDTEVKLSVFDEILGRLELFSRIINDKFSFSEKRVNFNKEKGFVISSYSSSGTQLLKASDLSSGEQHELILIYELLFRVKPNSFVLIDEPEISLHVGWQVNFLKDLHEISHLVDIDILVATHSPDIIQDRWDLTVELPGMAK
jgi:predicted ATPase